MSVVSISNLCVCQLIPIHHECIIVRLNVPASQCLLLDFLETLYTTKSKGSRTDPWAVPCFVVPQSKKNSEFHMMILF